MKKAVTVLRRTRWPNWIKKNLPSLLHWNRRAGCEVYVW